MTSRSHFTRLDLAHIPRLSARQEVVLPESLLWCLILLQSLFVVVLVVTPWR